MTLMNGHFHSRTSLSLARRRRHRRSGQTLVEYALLLAYIAVAVVQVLSNLSIYTTETYIDTNCSLIISENSSEASAQSAVLAYLESYDYGNYSTAQKTAIFNKCYDTMMSTIANSFG